MRSDRPVPWQLWLLAVMEIMIFGVCFFIMDRHTHTHTPSHTHTHTHTRSLSHTHSHTLGHTLSRTLGYTLSHTLTHTFTQLWLLAVLEIVIFGVCFFIMEGPYLNPGIEESDVVEVGAETERRV